jgi:hypothetical protein
VTATTDAPHLAAAPRAGGGIGGSVRDSLVVAKRNLIRMTRIPNPVRSSQSGSISPRIRDLEVSGLEVGGRELRLPALDGGGARWPNTSKEQAK